MVYKARNSSFGGTVDIHRACGFTLVAALTLMATAAGAQSDFGRNGVYAGLAGSLGVYVSEDDIGGNTDIDPAVGLNARLGYRLHPHVAAEGEFEWLSEADVEVGGSNAGTIEAWTFMAGLKVFALPDRLQPYLGLALGGMVAEAESGPLDNTESSFALRVGGGLDVYITRNIYGNFGISYVIPTDDMLDELDYVSFGWGLGYRF